MDEFAFGASVFVDSDFETACSLSIWVEMVDKLAGHGLFDLLDRCSAVGSVASATAVLHLHDMGCVIASSDNFHSFKINYYFRTANLCL